MSAMSAMMQLGIPHINVMSKIDLLGENHQFELDRFPFNTHHHRYFEADSSLLLEDANRNTLPQFHALNEALVRLV